MFEAEQIARSPRADGWSRLTRESLGALLVLDEIPFFGLQKFRKAYEQGVTPEALIAEPDRLVGMGGKRGRDFAVQLRETSARRRELDDRASAVLRQAEKLSALVLSLR